MTVPLVEVTGAELMCDVLAVQAKPCNIFNVLDQKTLNQKRGIQPRPIEFGDEHADLEIIHVNFDEH